MEGTVFNVALDSYLGDMIVVGEVRGGRSSIGRASVCGTEGRQFDPGRSPRLVHLLWYSCHFMRWS